MSTTSEVIPASNDSGTNAQSSTVSTRYSADDRSIVLHPNQPMTLKYPAKEYNGVKRRFQAHFPEEFSWLHWNATDESVYCHPCYNVHILGLTLLSRGRSGDTAFSSTGYSSWKCPTSDFRQHAGSPKHQECVAKWAHHLTGIDVNVQLNTQKLKEQQQNQNALRVMMQAVRYLAQQGLSMRGHIDDNGNFIQLLQLLASNNADLQAYLASGSRRKFLSHENQNDILKMMNHAVLRQIIGKVNAVKFFPLLPTKLQICHACSS